MTKCLKIRLMQKFCKNNLYNIKRAASQAIVASLFFCLTIFSVCSAQAVPASESQAATIPPDQFRQYVLFSFRHLAIDIIAGDGIYLEAILSRCSVESKQDNVLEIRKILLATQSIPDFSRQFQRWYAHSPDCV